MKLGVTSAIVVVEMACCHTGPTSRSEAPAAVTTPVASASPPKPAPAPEPLPPGHFTCHRTQCRKGETCCLHDEACTPRGKEPDSCIVRSECDTSADCGKAMSCCAYSNMATSPHFNRRCEAGSCPEEEACRKGTCPVGQRCEGLAPDDPSSIGWCSNAASRIACGKATCSGDEPWCSWDSDRRVGTCLPATDANFSAYRCDDDADCLAGARCWLASSGSYCCRGEVCYHHAVHSRYVACETASDCPTRPPLTFTCEREEGLPPWTEKRCVAHQN